MKIVLVIEENFRKRYEITLTRLLNWKTIDIHFDSNFDCASLSRLQQ